MRLAVSIFDNEQDTKYAKDELSLRVLRVLRVKIDFST